MKFNWLCGLLSLILLAGCKRNIAATESNAQHSAFEKCGITSAEYDRLMKLTQKDFDQDLKGGGWRAFGNKEGCADATAELIKDYILYSEPYPSEDITMLRWHAGQMKANANKYEEAVLLFRGTYNRPDHSGEWNYYVDATLGFLEGDKAKVEKAYQELSNFQIPPERKAAMKKYKEDNPDINFPENFGEQASNLNVVKSLLDCFGKSYAEAYGRCETSE